MSSAPSRQLSVVIPVYNEALNLPVLFARLYPVLDALGRSYEVIFTNDGSADNSFALLTAQHDKLHRERYVGAGAVRPQSNSVRPEGQFLGLRQPPFEYCQLSLDRPNEPKLRRLRQSPGDVSCAREVLSRG